MFRKAKELESCDNEIKKKRPGTEANSAFNMWSDARFPAAAPTLAEFLNWMPSTEPQDGGAAEDIQESAEAALAATSQGI
jgi:hypothetical protein